MRRNFRRIIVRDTGNVNLNAHLNFLRGCCPRRDLENTVALRLMTRRLRTSRRADVALQGRVMVSQTGGVVLWRYRLPVIYRDKQHLLQANAPLSLPLGSVMSEPFRQC